VSDIDKPVSLAALAKENERLRAENERWRDRVKSLPDHSDCRAEVKQLEQDYFDKCSELGEAMNEVERLRAAGEELREQLSLNKVHDRDCRARELEVERLRALVREAMGNVSADWFKHARQALGDTT
jgi:predicted RNase H-like nuclease (RuvC/YqgF family)